MTTYSDGMTVMSWFVLYLMAITLLCIAGSLVWPHVTAMVAAVRLEWALRKGTRR